jgi:hypothetical protein
VSRDGVRAALLLVLASCAVPTLLDCRPRSEAGAPCRIPDQLSCAGADSALVCDSGAWVAVPCRGPRGCARRGEADECDDTVGVDGDRCPRNPPLDYACSSDHGAALVCKAGRFSPWRHCRGPNKCQIVDGRNLQCDTTLAAPGDPCAQQGTYSCSVDGKAMLVCDGSAQTPASSCRGPDGCRVERDAHKVDCDDSVALEGDACDRPKRIACSVDHKVELVCDTSRYAKKRDCRRGECRLEGTELFCD